MASNTHEATSKSLEDDLSHGNEDCNSVPRREGFSAAWTRTLQRVMSPTIQVLIAIADHAARNPKTYVVSTIVFSFGIMFVGLATNFEESTDDSIWTPQNSKPVEHGAWLENDSNFPARPRNGMILVHRSGSNILGDDGSSMAMESVKRVFAGIDLLRETPGWEEVCSTSHYVDPITREKTCEITGITNFWNTSTSSFLETVQTNEQAIKDLSKTTFPSGRSANQGVHIGYYQADSTTSLMTYGELYITGFQIPPDDEAAALAFEEKLLERLSDMQDAWDAEPGNDFHLEYIADRSFDDEFTRATLKDLPLIPLVFLVMSLLCVFIFSKKDKVRSQSLLGFGAVATVLFAIMTSFGLMFAIGVPFTALTQILPFIMFGVGLDDAFIIYGSYSRTNPKKDTVERIHETIQDIGGTILLTTLTASVAFMLGLVSAVPAVRYLVMYAWPTILIDFFFQITFFVALIVIDEKRIQENRRDCCVCCSAGERDESEAEPENTKHFADALMGRYCDVLLQKPVKMVVLVIFPIILAFLVWRTTHLDQKFAFTEVVPSDSYITPWYSALKDYSKEAGVAPGVYFRDVNFADESIRQQMLDYVMALANSEYAISPPPEFWLVDFNTFVEEENMENMTFNEQLQAFLEVPLYRDVHGDNMVLDEDGNMLASRTNILFANVDLENVREQMDCLKGQREITKNQPVNVGRDEWAFFTFSDDYYIWEFYVVSPYELALSTILGTITVSILALLLIPHWQAILFVGPMVAVLYMDVLGFVELFGISINPVTYVAMVMSIGLMVDYVMHVTLRFLEIDGKSRQAKTKETLETIGASVMIGAFSTIVGVLPLAFSSSEIFFTVFVVFFGLCFFGCLHGLVLLPVLFSMFGPLEGIDAIIKEENSKHSRHTEANPVPTKDNDSLDDSNAKTEVVKVVEEDSEEVVEEESEEV